MDMVIKTIDNPMGKIAKTLLQGGAKLGVSKQVVVMLMRVVE